ncbi:MAG: hypothetical protein MPJ78_06365 [Hyphomicrobiaceae bacterium]|nr:hypothetical protein [Hyphomicrobiaceae bacterium]
MPGPFSRAGVLAALIALLLACAWPGAAHADPAQSAQTARALVPSPQKGKGDACVADTDFMRRYHMTVLNHQRDDTVHNGIRTKQFSLKECIACHAVQGEDARPVSIESPKHFCRTCHDYAAVKIDCFECHASRPESNKAAQLPTGHGDGAVSALSRYLKGKGQ